LLPAGFVDELLARCPADLLACVDSNVCLATIGTSVTANLDSLDLDDSRAIENLRTCIGTYGKRIPTSSAPSCVNRCREAAETCPFQSSVAQYISSLRRPGALMRCRPQQYAVCWETASSPVAWAAALAAAAALMPMKMSLEVG